MKSPLKILKKYGYDCNAIGHNTVAQRRKYSNPEPDAEKTLREILAAQWVSVEERLPEEKVQVYCRYIPNYHDYGVCRIGEDDNGNIMWIDEDGLYEELRYVTHWMEIPPLSEKP